MNKAIHLGIWGLGRIGVIHAEHFLRMQGKYEAAAFCDCMQDRVNAGKI